MMTHTQLARAYLGMDLVNETDDRRWHVHMIDGGVLRLEGRGPLAGKRRTLTQDEIAEWVRAGWFFRDFNKPLMAP